MRPMVYCVIPRELAPKLHELLRRHFSEVPTVEVVVERRAADRRVRADRRSDADLIALSASDRRRIPAIAGRRVADRRAQLFPVGPPLLPRRARPYAERLLFVERLEPSTQEAEDVDTARLVLRIQAGDRDAFAIVYTRYFDRVYAYLRLALKSAHEAEDAAQEVFIRVLAALPRYERRHGVPFRAWLFVVMRNHLRTELARRNRVELVEPASVRWHDQRREDVRDSEVRALSWISDKDVMLFMERLPLAQRQVLLLRYMLDLTPAQTAMVLGRSYEDVRKLQSRALRFLRERLSAVGRIPTRGHQPMVGRLRQAQVLRWRRFALSP